MDETTEKLAREAGGVEVVPGEFAMSVADLDRFAALVRADEREQLLPKTPPPGLLMSMAIRYDHGLAIPGYYDSEMYKGVGGRSHAQRLEDTLRFMRQLYEEVSGHGFYRPEAEKDYAALRSGEKTNG